jgi:P pilus assembly chaperone PapD
MISNRIRIALGLAAVTVSLAATSLASAGQMLPGGIRPIPPQDQVGSATLPVVP